MPENFGDRLFTYALVIAVLALCFLALPEPREYAESALRSWGVNLPK